MVSQKRCLLGRAGDCLFQMAKNWENITENLEDFHEMHDIEKHIEKELDKELGMRKVLKSMLDKTIYLVYIYIIFQTLKIARNL